MIRDIFDKVGAIFYTWPMTCRSCGESTGGEYILCSACRRKLAADEPHFGFGDAHFEKSAAAHGYAGCARDMVRTLKYESVAGIARDMAKDMVNAAEEAGFEKPDAVTYVPMHFMRRHDKYFDQAERLAAKVAAHWDMRRSTLLKRVKDSGQQARIRDAKARTLNVKDAFTVTGEVSGLHIVLIDDVCTTGATSRECARMLIDAGAARVDLLVYARAGRDVYNHQSGIIMQEDV